ncbi:DOPA 4,5-dioxygenase [Chromobacterium alkanivorans]|uniref:DOPA 4,5-dioxygenase family protein n=1 Tax=Chromobacterium alkanivorans TaxID=1071719 RepID=UPI002167A850|nr:DOPA 4,5-dioxygenase family protein [Chromobacterium alkanivorans]MCS3806486.1 DOPA 4,5-dioxygenase [Chromobacterium alkanivorans]MCS3820819.1 DOPA 4,5-dioxygenase [Chromobacterium alkanivorans]MCS3875741.1 DOPA 4,5-dioxygenase [Chromobacterium alkanivorans]
MQQVIEVTGYHAHVYYDAAQQPAARRLREAVAQRFEVELGRWREQAYGPHPVGAYQIAFAPALFGQIVPWLMLNREGLSVLLHPLSGDDVEDHSDFAMWLGAPLELNMDFLRQHGDNGRSG